MNWMRIGALLGCLAASTALAQDPVEPAARIVELLLSGEDTDLAQGMRLAAEAEFDVLAAVLETMRERALAEKSEVTSLPVFSCEAHTLRTGRDHLAGMGLSIDDLSPGGSAVFFLEPGQAAQLQAIEEQGGAAGLVASSKVTLHAGRTSTIKAVESVAYVSDYEVTKSEDAILADPIVETIEDGVVFEITPAAGAPDAAVRLEVDLTISALVRPIGQIVTSLGVGSSKVTIQLPELTIHQISTVVAVDAVAGGELLIVAAPGEGQSLVCLLLSLSSPGSDE